MTQVDDRPQWAREFEPFQFAHANQFIDHVLDNGAIDTSDSNNVGPSFQFGKWNVYITEKNWFWFFVIIDGSEKQLRKEVSTEVAINYFDRLMAEKHFCRGCGREESECSADPCPDVIEERKGEPERDDRPQWVIDWGAEDYSNSHDFIEHISANGAVYVPKNENQTGPVFAFGEMIAGVPDLRKWKIYVPSNSIGFRLYVFEDGCYVHIANIDANRAKTIFDAIPTFSTVIDFDAGCDKCGTNDREKGSKLCKLCIEQAVFFSTVELLSKHANEISKQGGFLDVESMVNWSESIVNK